MHLFTTNAGKIYKRIPGSTSRSEISIPGVSQVNPVRYPDFGAYPLKRTVVITGQFNKNLIWFTDLEELHEVGIFGPLVAPITSFGTGEGIIAASAEYAYSFVHIDSRGVVRGESTKSAFSIPLSPSGNDIVVSSLPTSHPQSRVTHKRIYRRDNGRLARYLADVAIGTASYTDTTASLDLGAVAPDVRTFPPYCLFNEVYHDRQWYAGDPGHPDRVYYSELGQPEAVGAQSFIPTRDGEKVSGLARCGDELVVFCAQSMYSIQGYTSDDFRMRKISPSVGCISNAGIVNISETLYFPSEQGVQAYNGALKDMMEDLQTYWAADYSSNTEDYQQAVGVEDREYKLYRLLIPKSSAFYYCGYYPPCQRGEQPYWSIDAKARKDSGVGLLNPFNSFKSEVVAGSCDGHVRKENDSADSDDDGDSSGKATLIQTGAILFSDPGGDSLDGKSFPKLWSYVESENTAWTFYALGGEESVVSVGTPNNTSIHWKDDRAASAASGKSAATEHFHVPQKVSGRCLQVRIAVTGADRFAYRGFGGFYGPGAAGRPSTS